MLDTVTGWGGPHIVELLVTDDPGHAIFDVAVCGKHERGALHYSARNRETWFSLGTDPHDAEIPLAEVRRAAHAFMRTGGDRPTGVGWQPR